MCYPVPNEQAHIKGSAAGDVCVTSQHSSLSLPPCLSTRRSASRKPKQQQKSFDRFFEDKVSAVDESVCGLTYGVCRLRRDNIGPGPVAGINTNRSRLHSESKQQGFIGNSVHPELRTGKVKRSVCRRSSALKSGSLPNNKNG
jgi:hypothetical protein